MCEVSTVTIGLARARDGDAVTIAPLGARDDFLVPDLPLLRLQQLDEDARERRCAQTHVALAPGEAGAPLLFVGGPLYRRTGQGTLFAVQALDALRGAVDQQRARVLSCTDTTVVNTPGICAAPERTLRPALSVHDIGLYPCQQSPAVICVELDVGPDASGAFTTVTIETRTPVADSPAPADMVGVRLERARRVLG